MGLSPIRFTAIDIELPGDLNSLIPWLQAVSNAEGAFIGKLDYQFCSDGHLLELNNTHLEHDYYTDIITFDESRLPLVRGVLFISLDRVNDNAAHLGEAARKELCRVMVHGLLHLIGYGDKSPKEVGIMREKETWALSLLH